MSNPDPRTYTRTITRLPCGCDRSPVVKEQGRCLTAQRLKADLRRLGLSTPEGHAIAVELARHLLRPENR